MRPFLAAFTASIMFAGPAFAVDVGKPLKSLANPVTSSLNDLTDPTGTPTVADLVNANRQKIEDEKWASPDSDLRINSQSDGSGAYNVQIQKKLLSF